MSDLNRQQLCAALGISESTVYRLEGVGLPYTPVGVRAKRYDLAECKRWLREHFAGQANKPAVNGKSTSTTVMLAAAAHEFTVSARRARLRVMPSD